MPKLSSGKRTSLAPIRNERGAAAVEFALTLLYLFLFFIAFAQIVEIFVAHERLSFASFVTSRIYSVHGRAKASKAANSIDPGISVSIEEDGNYGSQAIRSATITVKKSIDVPLDFTNIFSKGGARFAISKRVRTFRELDPGGDN